MANKPRQIIENLFTCSVWLHKLICFPLSAISCDIDRTWSISPEVSSNIFKLSGLYLDDDPMWYWLDIWLVNPGDPSYLNWPQRNYSFERRVPPNSKSLSQWKWLCRGYTTYFKTHQYMFLKWAFITYIKIWDYTLSQPQLPTIIPYRKIKNYISKVCYHTIYTGWWFEPLWLIWTSIGMMTFPIYGKIKLMFQTTNQYRYL